MPSFLQEFLEKTMNVTTPRCMKRDPLKAERVLEAARRAKISDHHEDRHVMEHHAEGGGGSTSGRGGGRRKSIDDIDRQHTTQQNPSTSATSPVVNSRGGSRRPSLVPDL